VCSDGIEDFFVEDMKDKQYSHLEIADAVTYLLDLKLLKGPFVQRRIKNAFNKVRNGKQHVAFDDISVAAISFDV
jgi:hypothetical protein